MKLNNKQTILIYSFVLFSFVALALLIRAPGLGKWCFAVDEYYFSRGVDFILEQGVPKFPNGGYYVRGIALQYMVAGISLFFKDSEFAIRLIPLICGVLSIPIFFLLCRLFLPLFPSILCSTILLFSSWHIEFSRFGRMYAPFQMIFFMFIYMYYKGYWQHVKRYKKASWLLAFISVFFYEGSVLLLAFFFLLFLVDESERDEEKVRLVILILLLFLINLFIHKSNLRNLGVINSFPPAYKFHSGSLTSKFPIILPKLTLFNLVWTSYLFSAIYIFLACVMLYIYHKLIYNKSMPWVNLITLISIILPLIHQFGLLVSVLFILTLCREDVRKSFLNKWKLWLSYLSISCLLWIAFGVIMKNYWFQGGGLLEFLKEMVKELLLFPPFHSEIIVLFARSTPVWSLLVLILIVCTALHLHLINRVNPSRFILLVVALSVFVISVLKKPYHDTRYFFFLYPIVYIMAFVEFLSFRDYMKRFVSKKKLVLFANGMILVPFLLFFTTEDFNIQQVFSVSSKEVNFRMGKYRKLAGHWYPRADFETPARYVNKVYVEGDVVVLDYSPVAQYLEKPFVNFISPELSRFKGETRKEGREQIWTGRPLLYDIQQLIKIIPQGNGSCLWLISIVNDFAGGSFMDSYHPLRLANRFNLSVSLEFVGIDGRIGVWKMQRR